jgi:hypothetical protein
MSVGSLYTDLEICDDYKTLPPSLYRLDAEDALYALDQVTARWI